MWGKDLLKKGLRFSVGDGRHIRAFRDPWLPRPTRFMSISPEPNEYLFVDSLIGDGGQWDLPKLQQVFLPDDVELILSITLSSHVVEDRLGWHYDRDDCFTLALQLARGSDVGCSSKLAGWWNGMWNLEVSPKVKVFLWRLYHDAVPVATNLIRRKIVMDPWCLACGGVVPETTAHAMVFYPRLQMVWEEVSSCVHGTLADLLVVFFDVLQLELFQEVVMVLWWIWFDRNACVFGGAQSQLAFLVSLARNALAEYIGNQKRVCVLTCGSGCSSNKIERWVAPPSGLGVRFR
ncbi:hypothetical protein F8388_015350 [Cannabis sativa]|uniref:Reverse transcriptase zinc-binding domain-containing protein n=1 Tax=Cannabis sativa TaxID=3483 RepID=A0A7J6GI20_CANSA|nr:hypothetical protein F8388_015350 [Cannabis sativa]KAF4394327.1 hypothetical protein G4B88_018477 [Cannabis sativa]